MAARDPAAEPEKYSAPALEKGLDILELLSRSPEPLSQVEIARSLGRAPNETYRMLNVLLRRRFVAPTPEGDRYRLSLKLLSLANAYPPMQRMREIAEPVMQRASWETRQSCHLAIWDDRHVVVNVPVATPGLWRWSIRAGSHMGLYNSGSGQTLIAFRNDKTRRFMIASYQPVEGETPVEEGAFFAKLDRIREAGFLREPSPTLEGVVDISFPILDPNGKSVCTLTCPYIRRIDSSNPPSIDEIFTTFQKVAAEISHQMFG